VANQAKAEAYNPRFWALGLRIYHQYGAQNSMRHKFDCFCVFKQPGVAHAAKA
jgi:hypothetical protein